MNETKRPREVCRRCAGRMTPTREPDELVCIQCGNLDYGADFVPISEIPSTSRGRKVQGVKV